MRNLYDHYTKEALCALLGAAGPVDTEKEVSPEGQRIDLYFSPAADRASALGPLGLLGRLVAQPCSLEHFHDSPGTAHLVACLRKHLNFCHVLAQERPAPLPPMMWVLSSGRPTSALKALGCTRARGRSRGVYLAAPALHMGVVVISELPEIRDTLLLRLLGDGLTLMRATVELRQLQPDALELQVVLPIMLRYRLTVPVDPSEQTSEDREFLMSTQDALEMLEQRLLQQGIEKGIEQGIQKGIKKGIEKGLALGRHALLTMYELRFGPVPAAVRARVQAETDAETLTRWCDLAAHEPREQVDRALTGA